MNILNGKYKVTHYVGSLSTKGMIRMNNGEHVSYSPVCRLKN
jgi:hypothetical protein